MSLDKYIKRINYIDHLIRLHATGTPRELALKAKVSERQLYNIISDLKEMGAPIQYCNQRKSYIYTATCTFKFGFIRDE